MIMRIFLHALPVVAVLLTGGIHGRGMADEGSETQRLLAHPELAGWPDMLRVAHGERTVDGDAVEVLFTHGAEAVLEVLLDDASVDWSGYEGISFSLENRGVESLAISITVMSRAGEARPQRSRRSVALAPDTPMALPFFFSNGNAGPYWGMRGIPVYHRLAQTLLSDPTPTIHLDAVTRVYIEVDTGEGDARLRLGQVALFTPDSPLAELVPYPFIDRYGQYKHADWPGKIHNEDDFEASLTRETALLESEPFPLALDRFGGWLDGPKREATGWFRVERIGDRWWFVTPEGHLFLSLGVNCVHYGDATFITGRDRWFESLPDSERFADCYGAVSGVHSLADPVGGAGRTLNHFRANLQRKHGEGYREKARDQAFQRLRAWGFNTVANWSDGDVVAHSPLPFTVTASSGNARPIAGSDGYWGKMKDVYDPVFDENTDQAIARAAAPWRDDPRVIGVFVDNEMSWSGIAGAALSSAPDQPARKAFTALLEERYGTIGALAEAWECDVENWETLRLPRRPNPQCREDADAFEYQFARRYFDSVAQALRRHAPHHLYLGCRFTPMYCPIPVLRACAETADVVSINLYSRILPDTLYHDLNKPVIIGEFHFGALDRGMFHTGLQASDDQAHRAACYRDYMESLARHPATIGAHWFQYMDQPTTGRTLDGENYNIGLVSIADEPYPELTRAARNIHQRMYAIRLDDKDNGDINPMPTP